MKQFTIALFSFLSLFADQQINDIPPRLQWMHNSGYCGEVSLINAGLYYGQYISQYDVRAISTKGSTQTRCQLLVGLNDTKAAERMHLQYEEWDNDSEQETTQFLAWIKQKVTNKNPVAIGLYINEYLFHGSTNPLAGDPDYDHIVTVTSLNSNHPLTDPTYYPDDQICFSDHGLWPKNTAPVYFYTYTFNDIQKSREEANNPNSPIYSLNGKGNNSGIAILGVKDLNGDTLPVRLDTNFNYEDPAIASYSDTRPEPMSLTLTITVSNLEPGVRYILYRYNDLDAIPDSTFNANASHAYQSWPFEIASGTTYTQTEAIQSNEIAAFRCVKSSAP